MMNRTTKGRQNSTLRRLYLKISGLLIILLLVIGSAYVIITARSAQSYYQETTQRLNSGVAEHMLLEVQPFVDGKVNEEALGQIMHSMMAVNPSLEVYLLSPEGEILSFVVLDKKVKMDRIAIDPVRRFITEGGESYILGDDPRNPGKHAVFSATEVFENDQLLGYVYMVLASEQFETISATLWNSYLLKTSSRLFIITLIIAFVAAFLVILWITENLRKIVSTARKFEEGDLSARIPVEPGDDLGQLATTFNRMADTLIENINQLKQVDHLRKELIANISHDLRTPLSVIHGYIETMSLKADSITEEERAKYLEIISTSTERLSKLVADLFELSRLEARQVKPNLEKFAIAELISDLTSKYQLMAERNGISLIADIQTRNVMVEADIALMERVLQNLLDNALKHTPQAGEVTLQLTTEKDAVKIAVENTGEGIPEAELEHLFDRYFKASSNEQSGSGLGLAIVKNILEIHDTVIEVTSKLRERTTFSFMLPARSTDVINT